MVFIRFLKICMGQNYVFRREIRSAIKTLAILLCLRLCARSQDERSITHGLSSRSDIPALMILQDLPFGWCRKNCVSKHGEIKEQNRRRSCVNLVQCAELVAPTGHFRRAESWILGLDIGSGALEASDELSRIKCFPRRFL